MNSHEDNLDSNTKILIDCIEKYFIENPINRRGMFNFKSTLQQTFSPDVRNFCSDEAKNEIDIESEINLNENSYEDINSVSFSPGKMTVNVKNNGKSIKYLVDLNEFICFLEQNKGLKDDFDSCNSFHTIDSDNEIEGLKVLNSSIEIRRRYSLLEIKLRKYFNSKVHLSNTTTSLLRTNSKNKNLLRSNDQDSSSFSLSHKDKNLKNLEEDIKQNNNCDQLNESSTNTLIEFSPEFFNKLSSSTSKGKSPVKHSIFIKKKSSNDDIN